MPKRRATPGEIEQLASLANGFRAQSLAQRHQAMIRSAETRVRSARRNIEQFQTQLDAERARLQRAEAHFALVLQAAPDALPEEYESE